MRTNRIKTGSILVSLVVFVFSSFLFLAQEPDPEMVFVRGGKLKMGSNLGVKDEQPVHDVFLDDFYIGKFEITQAQWKGIMDQDTNKCFFEGFGICPVERVCWYNVLEFIEKLNQKTGLNYRLPTEAEWEYAAKGGFLSKGYRASCVEEAGSTIMQACGLVHEKVETRLSDMVMSDSGYAVLQNNYQKLISQINIPIFTWH